MENYLSRVVFSVTKKFSLEINLLNNILVEVSKN